MGTIRRDAYAEPRVLFASMMTSRIRPAFAYALGMSVFVQSSSALAAPEATKAASVTTTATKPVKAPSEAELLKAGAKAQKAGDTKTAVECLEGADKAGEKKGVRKATTVLALAKAYDADKRYASAIKEYDAYVALAPKGPKKELDAAKARSAELSAMKPKLSLSVQPEGSLVTVDGAEVKGSSVEVAPGDHVVKATKDGFEPLETRATVPVATDTSVSLALKELPPPPPPPPPPVAAPLPPKVAEAPIAPPAKAEQDKTAAYVTGAIAVLAAGTGTAFGLMALSEKSDFDSKPSKAIADRGENYTLVADMSFGLAITFGLTSAVLFLTDDEEPAAKAASLRSGKATTAGLQVRPVPMIAPGMAGAGATFRF